MGGQIIPMLRQALKRWADFNGLSINVDDDQEEPNGKWLVCKHGLGENWAKIHAKSIKNCLRIWDHVG